MTVIIPQLSSPPNTVVFIRFSLLVDDLQALTKIVENNASRPSRISGASYQLALSRHSDSLQCCDDALNLVEKLHSHKIQVFALSQLPEDCVQTVINHTSPSQQSSGKALLRTLPVLSPRQFGDIHIAYNGAAQKARLVQRSGCTNMPGFCIGRDMGDITLGPEHGLLTFIHSDNPKQLKSLSNYAQGRKDIIISPYLYEIGNQIVKMVNDRKCKPEACTCN